MNSEKTVKICPEIISEKAVKRCHLKAWWKVCEKVVTVIHENTVQMPKRDTVNFRTYKYIYIIVYLLLYIFIVMYLFCLVCIFFFFFFCGGWVEGWGWETLPIDTKRICSFPSGERNLVIWRPCWQICSIFYWFVRYLDMTSLISQ